MSRTPVLVLGIFVAAAASAAAQAPAGGAQTPPPPPMTNLQIIPKDTPRPQVLQQMQAIAASLGVQCNYCHVMGDNASDDKLAPPFVDKRERVFGFCKRQVPPVLRHPGEM